MRSPPACAKIWNEKQKSIENWGVRNRDNGTVLLHACPCHFAWSCWTIWSSRIFGRCAFTSPWNFHSHCALRTLETAGYMTELQSEITCPKCNYKQVETMPTDACQWFYDCKGCGALLNPKQGDCCVFCSYGTVPCPPIQEGNSCC